MSGQVSEEAVEAGVRAASDQLGFDADVIVRERIEHVLRAALPALRAQWAKELLSDDAVQAGASVFLPEGIAPSDGEMNEFRKEFEAALASLPSTDQEGK